MGGKVVSGGAHAYNLTDVLVGERFALPREGKALPYQAVGYHSGLEMTPQSRRYVFINLPHAQTVLSRVVRWLEAQNEPCPYEETEAAERLAQIDRLLRPYVDDPPEAEAIRVADAVAEQVRLLVMEIERVGYRGDRLGQCVRNLFECLGLAEEGATLSLRCGERPDSPLRP